MYSQCQKYPFQISHASISFVKRFFFVGDVSNLKKETITIKEGVEYKLRIVFKVMLILLSYIQILKEIGLMIVIVFFK